MAEPETKTATAVPNKKVEVGINYPYPWDKSGVFFGSGQDHPGQDRKLDIWTANLGRNLDILNAPDPNFPDAHIKIVRLFLLCNATNFGTLVPGILNHKRVNVFSLPKIFDPIYTDQFEKMLVEFESRNMEVIPSLLSFEALARWDPPDVNSTKRPAGRGDLVANLSNRTWFLNNVLEPLLSISERHRGAIRAWEVINEPGQVVDSRTNYWLSWVGKQKTDYPIAEADMRAFLDDACHRIEARNFKSTVGHWYSDDLSLPTGNLPQFHYYPSRSLGHDFVGKLPLQTETKAFIGEFAALKTQTDQSTSVPWPEIPDADQNDPATRVFKRLKKIEEKGYEMALLWPDLGAVLDFNDYSKDPLKLSNGVIQGIVRYLTT
jgi:hypothetical protein